MVLLPTEGAVQINQPFAPDGSSWAKAREQSAPEGEPTYSHILVDVETVADQKQQAYWTRFFTADDR
jgi:hypothetical protein